jgi:hypothetical protein
MTPLDDATIARLNEEFPARLGARPRYYDPSGEPMGFGDWASAFDSDGPERFVAQENVTWCIRVSTVWLGLDHSFTGEGPPLIYETMIFGGPHDGDMWRYATREEAEAGHAHALAQAWTRRDRFVDALRNLRPVAPW